MSKVPQSGTLPPASQKIVDAISAAITPESVILLTFIGYWIFLAFVEGAGSEQGGEVGPSDDPWWYRLLDTEGYGPLSSIKPLKPENWFERCSIWTTVTLVVAVIYVYPEPLLWLYQIIHNTDEKALISSPDIILFKTWAGCFLGFCIAQISVQIFWCKICRSPYHPVEPIVAVALFIGFVSHVYIV